MGTWEVFSKLRKSVGTHPSPRENGKKGGRIFPPLHPRSALLQKVKHSCGKNGERRRRRRRFPTKHLRYAISHSQETEIAASYFHFSRSRDSGEKQTRILSFPSAVDCCISLRGSLRLADAEDRGVSEKKVGFFLKAKLKFLVGEVLRFSKKP